MLGARLGIPGPVLRVAFVTERTPWGSAEAEGEVARGGFLGDDMQWMGTVWGDNGRGEWLPWDLELESHVGRWGLPIGGGQRDLHAGARAS